MVLVNDLRTLVFLILAVSIAIWKLFKLFKATLKIDQEAVFIVVLGDVGRSPRMNYHSLSLAKLGYKVSIIGYTESKQMNEIQANKNIQIIPLGIFPKHLQVGPQFLQYGLKAFYLSLGLLFTLIKQKISPKFILVQNPPSVPTLFIAYLFAKYANTKFLIDWHNYGFTILSLAKGENNILVKICKRFEVYFGQMSDLNFCVTDAMKNDLLTQYHIKAITMHDKAHERFKQLDVQEKHDFYNKLVNQYDLTSLTDNKGNSIFSEVTDGEVHMKNKRPAILVSSSSWTEDEDFHLLVDALDIYQNKINAGCDIPDLVCMLTGKGPLKEYYKKLFLQKNFKNIQIHFLWLEPSDYPTLLGSSDIGISFHKSSSNLDLPMKVVDMFGTRLPVCAFKFSCISELVKENENGLLFLDGSELAKHLINLSSNLDEGSKLADMRNNLKTFSNWNEEWDTVVKPLLSNL